MSFKYLIESDFFGQPLIARKSRLYIKYVFMAKLSTSSSFTKGVSVDVSYL